jgi:hypothetical protein
MSRAFISLGVMLGCNYLLDLKNEFNVKLVQIVYALVATALYLGVHQQLEARIAASSNKRPVWVPEESKSGLMDLYNKVFPAEGAAPAAGAEPAAPKWKAVSSLQEYEMGLAKAKVAAAFMTAVQPLVFSFLMKIHIMCAIQVREGEAACCHQRSLPPAPCSPAPPAAKTFTPCFSPPPPLSFLCALPDCHGPHHSL